MMTNMQEVTFPEKTEYVISAREALLAIQNALDQIKGFREGRLYLFKTVIGPLVPASVRSLFEKHDLDNFSIAYQSLVKGAGNLLGALVLFGLDEEVESVKENQRFFILPFLELEMRKKIEQLERKKPFGWKIMRKFYQKNVDSLGVVVDNLISLVAIAWTFNPGIGEPEKETGFFNRFVFTSNGGFIDLGHFFNCAIIAYLYGVKKATERGEKTEVSQRWLREQAWLVKMRERHLFQLVTNLLWGYATSADTIEDRASDKFGIILGEYMRNLQNNGKIIDYFVELYPRLVYRTVKNLGKRKTTIGETIDAVIMFFRTLYRVVEGAEAVDIVKYMKNFFEEYDAIDPRDADIVPKGLFNSIIDFYKEKYGGKEWDSYTNKEWQVVIPQDLWEQIVRGRKKHKEKALPIKIQLKKSGKLVAPYPGEAPQ